MSDKQTSDVARDKAARLLKKRGSASSLMSSEYGRPGARKHGSVSTVSFIDEPQEQMRGPPVRLEPTFQLGPERKFPVSKVKHILMDVLESYLAEEKYEPELCRQMTKTISEVVKARVKDLLVKRYKVIVLIHIGQLKDQGMKMGSRCLWDPNNDTFSSYEFTNNSLFAVGNVYGVYYE
ncbi:dynein light chain Tctex-type 5-B-like [Glandiceps talaboti]